MEGVPDLSVLALGREELETPKKSVKGSDRRLKTPELAFSNTKDRNSELDEIPIDLAAKPKGKRSTHYNHIIKTSEKTGGGFWPKITRNKGAKYKEEEESDDEEDFTVSQGDGKNSKGAKSKGPFTYPYPIYFEHFWLNELTWPFMLWLESVYIFKSSDWLLREGGGFLTCGLFLAALSEAMAHGAPRYNFLLLLVLCAASTFERFPKTTIRPFLAIAFLAGLSIVVDCIICARPPASNAANISLTTLVVLVKILAIYQFINQDRRRRATATAANPSITMTGAGDALPDAQAEPVAIARKYLNRRTRVFCPTWRLPRRLMREVRNRILAVAVLQVVVFVTLFVMFMISITHMGYSMTPQNPHSVYGVSPAIFIFVKAVTTFMVFFALYLDMDVTLTLHHFGCMGMCPATAKKYIHEKREEYGGWPLAYAFNPVRFQFVCLGKVIDFAWGVVGWVTIVFSMASATGLSQAQQGFFGVMVFCLLIADVWVPLLLLVARWLIRKQEEVEQLGLDPDSDDSELEELGLREQELTPTAHKKITRAKAQRMLALRSPRQGANVSNDDDAMSSDGDEDDDYDEYSYSDEEDVDVTTPSMHSRHNRSRSSSRSSPKSSRNGSYSHDKQQHFYTSDTSREVTAEFDDEDLSDIVLDLERGPGVASVGAERAALDQWGSPYGRVGRSNATSKQQQRQRQQPQPQPQKVSQKFDSPPRHLSPMGGQAFSGAATHSPYMSSGGDTAGDGGSEFDAAFAHGGGAGSPMHPASTLGHNAAPLGDGLSPIASSKTPSRHDDHHQYLTLNQSARVAPRDFASKWQELDLHGHFDCTVATHPDFSYRQLSDHLRKAGFFVVAAGKYATHNSGDGRKLYVYGEAFTPAHSRVSFLCELKLIPTVAVSTGDNVAHWGLSVESKCQPAEHVAFFVQSLHFGSIFDLLDD